METKKFAIIDFTNTTDKNVLAENLELTFNVTDLDALVFDSKKEANKFILDNDIQRWAKSIEI